MERRNSLGQEYLYRRVITSSPAELLVILFDACIRDVKLAGMAMDETRPNLMKASDNLIKAQRIITELISSLDMDVPLSAQLLPVYEFLLHTLQDANVKKDMSQLPAVIEILSSQRDTWEQISKPAHETQEVLCG